jgi:[glutamine synthetase] adenylyltransferase / [glutamine synthetase]-adenylyl-L-tyrosine phosphorylase
MVPTVPWGDLIDAVAEGAPDPADSRRRVERFCEAAAAEGLDATLCGADPHPDAARILRLCCQRAPYLATLLCRDPYRLLRVAADPYLRREKPAAAIAAVVDEAAAADAAAVQTGLRRARADELVRLGVRELELGLDTEVGRELAHLADACFDAAIRFHDAALRGRHGPPRYVDDDGTRRDAALCVIGMGKLGGEELNFASDVDVIYVYSSDHGDAGGLSLHEYFAKLATAVTAALSEVTAEDVVFRVDLRLRPEGSRGAIANSLAQLERYYETFGRPWERQAWLKARPAAGDGGLGAAVMELMRPFVHPRHTAPTIVDQVRDLNRRIKAELVAPARVHGGFDVKNGDGGIREIEFFVQALQLIHAGRDPHLRARGTLTALDQLLFAGLVADDEHLALYRAYRWLRHVEHLLQLDSGLQTQTVPADPQTRALLARRLGVADLARFEADLARHTGAVARLFATLGDGDGDADAAPPWIAQLIAGELPADRERELLARLGLADVDAAARELDRHRRRPGSPLGPAATGVAAQIGPALLEEIASSADPDQALRHLGDLVARRGPAASLWRLCADRRPILRLLVSILGASEYLARSLVDRPELLDLFVAVPAARGVDVAGRLAAVTAADPDDEELVWSALAEAKNLGVLQVGLADFAGTLDPLEVCAELTHIAEATLGAAFERVAAGIVARHGVARHADGTPATMAVLGLGKLGGRELGYAADLDVVFVYSDDGESDGARPLDNVEYMTRLAQRLVGGLHARTPRGRLYELDARLRPSGSQGLLVSSLSGWKRYHERGARLWERQALIKLRPVAGDPALGAAVAAHAHDQVWGRPPGDPAAIAREVAAMRDRIERELGSPSDLKVGRGGIIDVEFAAQLVQLACGHDHPELRTPSTAAALRAAAAADVADPAALALLEDGYRFLRRIEHRLRVVNDMPVQRLPDDPRELEKLARRAGFPSGAVLRDRTARWRDDIRRAYEQILSRPR